MSTLQTVLLSKTSHTQLLQYSELVLYCSLMLYSKPIVKAYALAAAPPVLFCQKGPSFTHRQQARFRFRQ